VSTYPNAGFGRFVKDCSFNCEHFAGTVGFVLPTLPVLQNPCDEHPLNFRRAFNDLKDLGRLLIPGDGIFFHESVPAVNLIRVTCHLFHHF
jgi:hypothetical protein